MLIKDESTILRHQAGTAYETEVDALTQKAVNIHANAVILENEDLDPTNYQRQLGRTLHHAEVERRLAKIAPSLIFSPHPNPTKRAIYRMVDGVLTFVLAMESGMVPENSTMDKVYQDVLTPEALKPSYSVDRADVPKSQVTPHTYHPDGSIKELGSIDFGKDTLLPGFRREVHAYSEIKRGYRTVGALLILAGLITVGDFEREFGSQNKAAYAAAVGRRKKVTPW